MDDSPGASGGIKRLNTRNASQYTHIPNFPSPTGSVSAKIQFQASVDFYWRCTKPTAKEAKSRGKEAEFNLEKLGFFFV